MLVYRDQKRTMAVAQELARFRAAARALDGPPFEHDRAVELVVGFGELEAGVADALLPDSDWPIPVTTAFRQASLLLGHALYHSWRQTGQASRWLSQFQDELKKLYGLDLPETAQVSVPEGYAYYGLYPEAYILAAQRFSSERRPSRAVVIGIRSIGTSLSAIVAATLDELRCLTVSYTVRPQGHPFDRQLILSAALEDEWRLLNGAYFLVVDEGPGLSGSSFLSVARALARCGVPEERIVLLPSWIPAGASLLSSQARASWDRYEKHAATFEQVWAERRSLFPSGAEAVDLSGGRWRELAFNSPGEYPAVNPQHERIKYRVKLPDGQIQMYRFVGLAGYGRARLARQEQLAEAGLAPRPLGLVHGFLATEMVHGQPLAQADQPVLEAIAAYSAFLAENSAEPGVPFGEMVEMVRVNTTEGLGADWGERLGWLARYETIAADAPACRVDGRMLPHEWLKTPDRLIKTDGIDHGDDHFLPGSQNIAWDLAGACVEFNLTAAQRTFLLDRYGELTKDRDMARRLPFYLAAYLAFRLGYAAMARDSLEGTADGKRFQSLVVKYADQLRHVIRAASE